MNPKKNHVLNTRIFVRIFKPPSYYKCPLMHLGNDTFYYIDLAKYLGLAANLKLKTASTGMLHQIKYTSIFHCSIDIKLVVMCSYCTLSPCLQ